MPLPTHRLVGTAAAVGAIALAATLPAQAQSSQPGSTQRSAGVTTVTSALNGPRGVDAVTARKILVGQADGTFSRVVRRLDQPAKVVDLGKVPDTGLAPAIAKGLHRTVWILTGAGGEPGGPPIPGASTLYKWRPGWAAPKPFVDIAAYQKTHPDPYNLADDPGESNPYGLVALADGSVLVADAANNDLLRVKRNRHVQEVAMLKPRTVPVPSGLGPEAPPAGTMMPSEAVATSVTVGRDGYWYVGELRGFPATPGTSQIWRIKPYTTNNVCDPVHPRRGKCKRYADGLTSIVDLGTGPRGIYAVELSKMSWLAMESHAPGSDVGALMYVHRVHGHKVMTELAKDQLHLPGGVDVLGRNKFVTAPIFGPGSLLRIR